MYVVFIVLVVQSIVYSDFIVCVKKKGKNITLIFDLHRQPCIV